MDQLNTTLSKLIAISVFGLVIKQVFGPPRITHVHQYNCTCTHHKENN